MTRFYNKNSETGVKFVKEISVLVCVFLHYVWSGVIVSFRNLLDYFGSSSVIEGFGTPMEFQLNYLLTTNSKLSQSVNHIENWA
jgi:hypothetical protein